MSERKLLAFALVAFLAGSLVTGAATFAVLTDTEAVTAEFAADVDNRATAAGNAPAGAAGNTPTGNAGNAPTGTAGNAPADVGSNGTSLVHAPTSIDVRAGVASPARGAGSPIGG